MQFDVKDYNKDMHDKFKALVVKQPYADLLCSKLISLDGIIYAEKSIEVRSKNTKYRGELLICSSSSSKFERSGCSICLVELYDVKPISEFTKSDWLDTCIPKDVQSTIKGGYGWLMRNPRKVIEYPTSGQLGIFNLIYSKGLIEEYPTISYTIEDLKKLKDEKNNKL